MQRAKTGGLLAVLTLVLFADPARAEKVEFERTRDVIYGRKFGLAMTMDVFTPKKPNGFAVIAVASGGWFSRADMIQPGFYIELLKRGYTVFAVVHGSQPKFTVLEILDDMHRAVRFIRFHAKKYGIDADHVGITGISAGGHLSLMQGTAGDKGNPKASDPVDRVSSQVQAVACFVPPTDFLNFGKKGNELIDRQLQPPFTAAVDYHDFDVKKARFVPITDKKKLREIARRISPISHVTANSAPALILHGEKDPLVPLQQSESIVAKYKEAGATAKLVVRKDAGHTWPTMILDMDLVADWFDVHLRKLESAKR